MTVEQTLLVDMSKASRPPFSLLLLLRALVLTRFSSRSPSQAITELEVALSILRPELRIRDEQLLGMGKNDKKKMKKQREKEDKLERELSGLGKNGKQPKKPRTSKYETTSASSSILSYTSIERGLRRREGLNDSRSPLSFELTSPYPSSSSPPHSFHLPLSAPTSFPLRICPFPTPPSSIPIPTHLASRDPEGLVRISSSTFSPSQRTPLRPSSPRLWTCRRNRHGSHESRNRQSSTLPGYVEGEATPQGSESYVQEA